MKSTIDIRQQKNLHENMMMEFRMVNSTSPMLLTEALNWRDVLSDIVQAAASSGAIIGTGGAGGDIVVDVMFAIKSGKEVLDTVESLISSATDLMSAFARILVLDISMGAEAFFSEVRSIIDSFVSAAGDLGEELLLTLREGVDDIIGQLTRAISKWVATILPDDFGLAGPAFEITVTKAISSVAENSYDLLMLGISALGETGELILNEEAFRNWLDGLVDSVLSYANQFLEEAETVDPEKAGWLRGGLASYKFGMERMAKGSLPGWLAQKAGLLDDKGFVEDYLEVLPSLPEHHPMRKLILMASTKGVEWLTDLRAETVPMAASILHKLITYLVGSVAVLQAVASYQAPHADEEPVVVA